MTMTGPQNAGSYIWSEKGSQGPEEARIYLTQAADGFRWFFTTRFPELVTDSGMERATWLEQLQRHGVVFYAHPRHHRLPWEVADEVSNAAIRTTLSRLSFKLHKRQLAVALRPLMQRLEAATRTDRWQRAVAHQRPFQVWKHAHGLTEYQVWTCYRIASKQLNLYNENRNDDNSCRTHQACREVQETLAHIFWDCPKARSCWAKLIGHWTGETVADLFGTCQYLDSANRQAPAISPRLRHRLHQRFTDDAAAGVRVWKRIWFLMSNSCLTHLWQERNDAVFRGVLTTASHSVTRFWETGRRQLLALAKCENRGIGTVVQGALLHVGIELFTQAP